MASQVKDRSSPPGNVVRMTSHTPDALAEIDHPFPQVGRLLSGLLNLA